MKELPNFLTPKTKEIFLEISKLQILKKFTLVGRTGLAYHLEHRLSEDLDYFSWENSINKNEFDAFKNKISLVHELKILNEYDNGIDISVDGVKLTFFANNWSVPQDNRKLILDYSFVAPIEILTAMKVNAISLRAKYRDYYDLYVLSKELFNIHEIFNLSMKYIPGMTKKIFCMQLIYIDDINDENINHLQPRIKISLTDIQKHFEKEIKKLIS